MRGWMLVFALIAAPAWAADDLATMNAASQAWDRYALLSSRDDPASVDLLAAPSVKHHEFLRDAALYGSAEQVRRIPLGERAVVYALRASVKPDTLATLDGTGLARYCIAHGMCGVSAPDEGEPLPQLSHVTLLGPAQAIGELGPPTGTQFQFGPELALEDGRWKVRPESLTLDASTAIAQQIQRSGLTETQMLEGIVTSFIGTENGPPVLAALDRPLRDDTAARTRLNETWPKYEASYRARFAAMEKKATDGDSLAMFGLGAVLYTGAMPTVLPKDTVRGLRLLEQASDAGNVQAAMAVVQTLVADYQPAKGKPVPAAHVAKVARHMRRAAEGGIPIAMNGLGGFIFNGAGGLTRDCAQAEEWSARAEDAGIAQARNERVWFLATCPIAAQRDPKRALELASFMIENAGTLSSSELDTVAAALAANGRYDEARDFQQRAIAKLDKDATDIRRRMQQRLGVYQKRKDWVQDYNQYELPVQ